MEVFREEIFKSTYFYSKENISVDESILLVGRQGFDEYRSVLEVDTSRIRGACINEENVSKIELNLFLGEILLEEHVAEYGIDICRNIEILSMEEINFLKFPKFNQSYAMYNIKEKFVGKFVKFDITHLKEFFFLDERISFTILGLGAGGIVKFLKGKKRLPHLRFECDKVNKIIKSKVTVEEKGGYGFFISDEVETVSIKNYRAIKWSKSIVEKSIYIAENKYEIVILNEGVYSIDYSLNIRSESEGYMFLKVNSTELDYTFIKTTFDEHGYTGSVLVECKRESKIILCIIGKGILIQEFGGIGSIRVIRI